MATVKGRAEVERQAQKLERLEVVYVPIDSVKPNDYNPNRQSERDMELLRRSMAEDGFTQPVVVQRDGSVIVDGEHRWRVAYELGMAQIPVVFVDMTPEQMRIATLRHNRARGSEDAELAAAVLRDLQQLGALDWAQDQLLLDDVEIQRMISDVPAAEALAAEEFSQGWEPSDVDDDEPQSVETREFTSRDGGAGVAAMSAAAIATARAKEAELAAAGTSAEREAIRQRQAGYDPAERRYRPEIVSKFFRLMLVFEGEEADEVKGALGAQAADRLLEMLREWVAAHPEDAPLQVVADGGGE